MLVRFVWEVVSDKPELAHNYMKLEREIKWQKASAAPGWIVGLQIRDDNNLVFPGELDGFLFAGGQDYPVFTFRVAGQ
jgi:hypothetical protein